MSVIKSSDEGAQKGVAKKQAKATDTTSVPFQEVEESKSGETVSVEEPAKKEVVAPPVDDNAKAIKFLTSEIEALKSQLDKAGKFKVSEEVVITETEKIRNDTLDKPVIFFTFSTSHTCFGDRKNGRDILPPDGERFEFKNLARYNKPKSSGRGVTTISVSQCTVYSREKADWMKDHSNFGIKYFQSVSEAQNVDITLADKMSQVSGMVRNLTDHEVLKRATDMEIDVSSPDVSIVRNALIRNIAMKEIRQSKDKYAEELSRLQNVDGNLTVMVDGKVPNHVAEMNPEVEY